MNQAVGIAITLIAILCGIIAACAMKRRRQLQLFNNMGIVGPEPEFLWGNLRHTKASRLEMLSQWRQKYGTKFGIYFGGEPFLVIGDPEMVHECFVKKSAIFLDRVTGFVETEPFKSSLFQLNGPDYKRVRGAFKHVFTPKNMKALSTPANLCAACFVEGLEKDCRSNGYVEVFRHATAFSMEFMAKALLSWKVGCQEDLHDRALKGMIHITDELEDSAIDIAFAIPALRHVLSWIYPFTKHARIFGNFMNHVRDAMRSRRSGKGPKGPDLLRIIMDEQMAALKNHLETASDRERYLDDQDITSNIVILLLAGYEAMSSALSFLTYLLAKHPNEQNEILKEIDQLFPNRGSQQLSYDELRQLKRLDMVVKEGLRLYPPVPLTVTRRCTQDTTACGQFIPAGVNVLASSWLIHRDPVLWPNPEEFVPERFAAGSSERYPSGSYVPFGLGPRSCIGRELGPLIVKSVLIQLLQTCKLSLLDSMASPVRPHSRALTLVPKDGIKIRVERRLTREAA